MGVLATVGTCATEVYPKTIARTFAVAGRKSPVVTQWGSTRLAGVIEGDPTFATPLGEQAAADVRALVETHRAQMQAAKSTPLPLQKIVLGCTHFPLAAAELDAAFEALRKRPDLTPWIAPRRIFVNPAEWTAGIIQRARAAHLRRVGRAATVDDKGAASPAAFYISVAHDGWPGVKLAALGVLDMQYKYQRPPAGWRSRTHWSCR